MVDQQDEGFPIEFDRIAIDGIRQRLDEIDSDDLVDFGRGNPENLPNGSDHLNAKLRLLTC